MAGLSGVAEEYFSNLNPIASRIYSDILETKNAYENLWDSLDEAEKCEILDECIIKPEVAMKYAFLEPFDVDLENKGFNKSDILSYFDIQCGQKIIQDDSSKFKDEHSAPFSFFTKSQIDLCTLSEKRTIKQKIRTKPSTPPVLKSELALSHSKVLSELKNALKSNEKYEASESKDIQIEFSPKPSKLVDDISSAGGFISKLINNKRSNKGNSEEREHLVSPERQCQIVASSDNYFKTNFRSASSGDTLLESQNYTKELQSPTVIKSLASYRSNSGLEEAHALLNVGSCKSGDTESSLCDTDDSVPCSLPKTGLDFLDNW